MPHFCGVVTRSVSQKKKERLTTKLYVFISESLDKWILNFRLFLEVYGLVELSKEVEHKLKKKKMRCMSFLYVYMFSGDTCSCESGLNHSIWH